MENRTNHILVVDDNLKNLQLAAQVLKEAGFLISLAESGEQAMAILQDQPIELILLDIMMPGIDGYQTCIEIKNDHNLKDIPIIFLTAKNQANDLVKGFEAGGADYVTKPFRKEELLARVKHHVELARARHQVLEMNKNRDKLYSIIAHDIRSPLATIMLTFQSIVTGMIDCKDEYFNVLVNDTYNLTKSTHFMVENLLKWTKAEGGAFKPKPELQDISPLVNECLQLFMATAAHKKIEIGLQKQGPSMGYFDEVSMHTVLRNLISNALKFTPEGGKVNIAVLTEANRLKIEVQDTGKGMPADLVEKLFVKNEQFTSRGTNNERGSGLGLVLVKEFVKQNNGQITINSLEKKGTTFTITLPVVQQQL
ncbi:MAG: hybrid sensor histidine kinase/response regulator [Bacteroidales bacterium]|nr:hybrid sensor histidine kinase/response regulator [Bacteroidales bacterium]